MIAAAAVNPAAAELITPAYISVTFPATQTPGTCVAPLESAAKTAPRSVSPARCSIGLSPSDSSTLQCAKNNGATTSACRVIVSPEANRTPRHAIVVDEYVGDVAVNHRDAAGGERFPLLLGWFRSCAFPQRSQHHRIRQDLKPGVLTRRARNGVLAIIFRTVRTVLSSCLVCSSFRAQ